MKKHFQQSTSQAITCQRNCDAWWHTLHNTFASFDVVNKKNFDTLNSCSYLIEIFRIFFSTRLKRYKKQRKIKWTPADCYDGT